MIQFFAPVTKADFKTQHGLGLLVRRPTFVAQHGVIRKQVATVIRRLLVPISQFPCCISSMIVARKVCLVERQLVPAREREKHVVCSALFLAIDHLNVMRLPLFRLIVRSLFSSF
jgi:hypothetical protein